MADRFNPSEIPPLPPLQAMNNLPVSGFAVQERRTKDGQPPKRRGPKPDSRPAMTRRQQLNRQAQRTHRERKEQYIRNLEDEVHKLRATLLENSKEKELIMNVNKMLRNVLTDSGIPLPPQVANSLAHVDSMMMADARNISNQTNVQTFTSTGQTPIVSPSQQDVTSYPGGVPGAPSIPRPMLEQEQAGIEFVLTYDNQDRARAYLSPPPQ